MPIISLIQDAIPTTENGPGEGRHSSSGRIPLEGLQPTSSLMNEEKRRCENGKGERKGGGEGSLEEDRDSGGLDHIYELPATAFRPER